MIVYLSSNENAMKFEFLDDEKVVNRQVKSEMTGEQLLNFVKTDLRNLDINLLIIDLGIMKDSQDENILAALSTYQILFTESKVLLFNEEEKHEELLKQYAVYGQSEVEQVLIDMLNPQKELQYEEDTRSIDKEEEENLEELPEESQIEIKSEKEEIGFNKECDLYQIANQKIKTHEGVPLEKQVSKQAEVTQIPQLVKLCEEENWNCSNIIIAYIGATRRTGTTTAAMHLCSHLKQQGANVSYSEAVPKEHKHLQSIAKEYDMEELTDCYQKDGIRFYSNSAYDLNAGMNFIILDLGAYTERPDWICEVLNKIAPEVVVVAGGRLYEVQELEQCMEHLDMNLNVLLNFATDQEFETVRKKYKNERVGVYRGKYEPSLFASTSTETEFAELLQVYNK